MTAPVNARPFEKIQTPDAYGAGVSLFSDWRIQAGRPGTCVLFPRPGSTDAQVSLDPVIVPDLLRPLALNLSQMVPQIHDHYQTEGYRFDSSFIVEGVDENSDDEGGRLLRFRAQALGQDRFALRLLSNEAQGINDPGLRIQPHAKQLLCSPEWHRVGGLILVVGSTGSGKTTTVCATVRYHLETYGGYAMLVEEPVESPPNLWGWVGKKGWCDPVDASISGFQTAIQWGLRAAPVAERSLLMIGEIRTPEAAVEAIRAAVDGRKVIATVHGRDEWAGLQRLVSLAVSAGEPHSLACEMLADGMFGVLFQESAPPGVKFRALAFEPKLRTQIRSRVIGPVNGGLRSAPMR